MDACFALLYFTNPNICFSRVQHSQQAEKLLQSIARELIHGRYLHCCVYSGRINTAHSLQQTSWLKFHAADKSVSSLLYKPLCVLDRGRITDVCWPESTRAAGISSHHQHQWIFKQSSTRRVFIVFWKLG